MTDILHQLDSFRARQGELEAETLNEDARRRELGEAVNAVRYCVAQDLPPGTDFYEEFAGRLVKLVALLDERGMLDGMFARLAAATEHEHESVARDAVAAILTAARDGKREGIVEILRPIATLTPVAGCVNRWLRHDLYEPERPKPGQVCSEPPSGGEQLQPRPVGKPMWDRERRELTFEGRLCKRFRQVSGVQTLILDAFEEDGWPSRIDNPVADTMDYDSPRPGRRRAADAIKRLNDNPCLYFGQDGTGEGILWSQKVNDDEAT
jgi:hypothetical protein